MKFRARVEDRWVYTSGVYFDKVLKAWLVLDGEIWVESSVLQRFTGMYDLNKNEIYEGDVLKREYSLDTTYYDPETLGVVDYEGIEGYFLGEVWYRPSEGFIMKNATKVDRSNETETIVPVVKIYSTRSEIVGNVVDGVSKMY